MSRRFASWRHAGLALALTVTVVSLSSRAVPARGQDNQVVEEVSHDEMQRLLRSMGFEFTEINEGVYRFQLSGYTVILFNSEKNCQLFAGFSREHDLTTVFELPRIINEWNRTKRFSKAYIDNDGDPCIEADLDFEGGVTQSTIREFIRTFRISVEAFVNFLDNPKSDDNSGKAAE